MRIFDIRILEGVPFDQYLQLPGISFSAVKGATPINPTDKMRLGTRVHTYLLEPAKYDGTDYRIVRAIAEKVNSHLGILLKTGKCELTVMCTMVHNGFYLYYKGRVDIFAGCMIIDLKVSDLPVLHAINHFGYNNQINGYAIPLKAKAGILFSIHPKTLNVQIAPIPNNYTFWERAVLQYGKPL